MVRFENVSKVYPDGTKAVDGLDLEIAKGQCAVFIGPSGCGKTTSLRLINRLEELSGGNIYINGKTINSFDPVMLRRNIGYVIQETGLMPHLTVSENIAMVLHLHKWSRKKIFHRVNELLEMAGLDPDTYRNRLPQDMSGGQRQRIGVLRALASEPDVVLMDEPFGALDPISREHLQNELLGIQEKLQKTIIFVTHDIDEALKLGDTVVLMRGGKAEQIGSPDELLSQPKNSFVRDFIGEDQLSRISPDGEISPLIEDAPLIIREGKDPQFALDAMEDEGRESAQLVDKQGKWKGMLLLKQVKRAAKIDASLASVAILDRKLKLEEAVIRDAAGMLSDRDIPIPVINNKRIFQGLITSGGVSRLAISRLTRNQAEKGEKSA